MKLSKYNIVIDTEKGMIAYNSISNQLFKTGDEFDEITRMSFPVERDDLTPELQKVFDQMLSSGFIIDDGADEIEMLKIAPSEQRKSATVSV